MPTYEYACRTCGHTFEQHQSMKDAPLTDCPTCQEPTLKRLIGKGAGLIFKGSGFYITDYKNAQPEGSSKKDSESSPPTSSGEKSQGSNSSESGKTAEPSSKPAPARETKNSSSASAKSES